MLGQRRRASAYKFRFALSMCEEELVSSLKGCGGVLIVAENDGSFSVASIRKDLTTNRFQEESILSTRWVRIRAIKVIEDCLHGGNVEYYGGNII
ncbi:hypothetical protein Tco_0228943 [Tanacetum coccineum]